MDIVVLDGNTLNPGDLDWEPVRAFGSLTVYLRTQPSEIVERALQADVLLTNKVVLNDSVLQSLPKLRWISLLSTGTNAVDLKAARQKGIVVSNIPSYSTDSVVQWTFAHLLNLASRLMESAESVRKGEWSSSPDFTYWKGPLIELSGQTLGIVGFGSIGQRVAAIAQAFGMKVIAFGPRRPIGSEENNVQFVSLEDLLACSDIVSLHCPLKDENREMINANSIEKMKPGAFLINTARGGLLQEQAVAEALNSGRLGGAGLDVLSSEPPESDNPLLSAKNCFITPHNAWATCEARKRLLSILIENLHGFQSGIPVNVVN